MDCTFSNCLRRLPMGDSGVNQRSAEGVPRNPPQLIQRKSAPKTVKQNENSREIVVLAVYAQTFSTFCSTLRTSPLPIAPLQRLMHAEFHSNIGHSIVEFSL